MPAPVPTVDELVETIKRSALPTILIEGSDDMNIYRWMQGQLGAIGGDFLSCGGRIALLELFRRRSEFLGRKVAFVADRDMWLYTGIPTEYADIIWTEGYSIENDIYLHSDIERLLDSNEIPQHRLLVEAICRWFAFEVEEHRANRPIRVETSIFEVVPVGATDIDTAFVAKRGYRAASPQTVSEIMGNYQCNLRGHQLFQILLRFLSASGRTATHSRIALYENCVKTRNHPSVNRLLNEIRAKLD